MVNALRCNVWVVCAHLPLCIVACFIGFVEVHPYLAGFCTFWRSAVL